MTDPSVSARTSTARRIGFAAAAISAVLFSAKAILAKLQYRYGIDALDVVALRMAFAAPLFGALAWREANRGAAPLSGRDRLQIVVLGLLGYYLASLLDFWGLEYVPVALERLILFLGPTFVLLIGLIAFGRPVSRRQWIAMAVSYAGIVLVMFESLRVEGAHVALGCGLILGAAVSYSIYLALSGEIVQRIGSLRLVAYAMSVSVLAVLVHYLALRSPAPLLQQPVAVYAYAAANAVFCTFLPVTLTMAAVMRIGSGLTAQLSVLGPVSLVFLGAWILDEPITLLQLAGTAVVIAGVVVLSRK